MDETANLEQAQIKLVALVGAWAPKLLELGNDASLPLLAPGVQATLVMQDSTSIHDFIISLDKIALSDCDEDGETVPLILNVLDISQWTLILSIALKDSDKALEELKLAHLQLVEIL